MEGLPQWQWHQKGDPTYRIRCLLRLGVLQRKNKGKGQLENDNGM
jgi:hypothetical protein